MHTAILLVNNDLNRYLWFTELDLSNYEALNHLEATKLE